MAEQRGQNKSLLPDAAARCCQINCRPNRRLPSHIFTHLPIRPSPLFPTLSVCGHHPRPHQRTKRRPAHGGDNARQHTLPAPRDAHTAPRPARSQQASGARSQSASLILVTTRVCKLRTASDADVGNESLGAHSGSKLLRDDHTARSPAPRPRRRHGPPACPSPDRASLVDGRALKGGREPGGHREVQAAEAKIL